MLRAKVLEFTVEDSLPEMQILTVTAAAALLLQRRRPHPQPQPTLQLLRLLRRLKPMRIKITTKKTIIAIWLLLLYSEEENQNEDPPALYISIWMISIQNDKIRPTIRKRKIRRKRTGPFSL
ncbi:uncharacterized protein LOC118746939 [Rhagoletis pomonella]|uniref:uncharacterized protein LOC118746939 n=1 Tax=Rhagoletis pomonella TaxID=28610 RepID=UPI0017802505|nr:uncharacterized protein LOC118746939 [Rhagoletis pomonella]